MFFEILIITYLDPFCVIPISSVFYFIYEIINYCITLPITNKFSNAKFGCFITSNFLNVILSSIHLEIIELHFCNCDIFLRRNIIQRESLDKSFIISYSINDDERDDISE